jgi:hypothetical protein
MSVVNGCHKWVPGETTLQGVRHGKRMARPVMADHRPELDPNREHRRTLPLLAGEKVSTTLVAPHVLCSRRRRRMPAARDRKPIGFRRGLTPGQAGSDLRRGRSMGSACDAGRFEPATGALR